MDLLTYLYNIKGSWSKAEAELKRLEDEERNKESKIIEGKE